MRRELKGLTYRVWFEKGRNAGRNKTNPLRCSGPLLVYNHNFRLSDFRIVGSDKESIQIIYIYRI